MNRLNFYFDRLVQPDDLNDVQENTENAIQNTVQGWLGSGILAGLSVTAHDPADLSVSVSTGAAWDSQGRRVYLPQSQDVDLSGNVTDQPRYVSVCIKYQRYEHNQQSDGYGQSVNFNQDDSYQVVTHAGTPADQPERPQVPDDEVLLADVLLPANATAIETSDIDTTRRAEYLTLAELQKQLAPVLHSVAQGNTQFYQIIRHGLGSLSLAVFVMPTQDPGGNLGNIVFIASANVLVFASTAADHDNPPSLTLDYLIVGKDSRAEQAVDVDSSETNHSVEILHGLPQDHFTAALSHLTEESSPEEVGEWWVSRDDGADTIQFTADMTDIFVAASELFDAIGTASFNGRDGTTINHTFAAANHQVFVAPIEDTDGDLGEVWVEKGNNQSVVKNSGGFRGQFVYVIKEL